MDNKAITQIKADLEEIQNTDGEGASLPRKIRRDCTLWKLTETRFSRRGRRY